jgi:hypothetical protein
MSTARVDDIDPIRDFRIHLTKFQEMAGRALSDADSDVNRMMRWLEGEGLNLWTSAIRKRQEILAKAEEVLRFKRLYKDASGSTPSVVEEQKAVKKAKDSLAEAQEKLKNVKHWTRALQKEQTLYRGAVASFSNDVAAGVPQAIGYLGALLAELEKYLDLEAASAGEESVAGVGAGAGREDGGPSMARAAEEAQKGPKGSELDPAELRGGIPTEQAILAAKPGETGPVQMSVGQVAGEQAVVVAKFASGTVPADEERIVISPGIVGATRLVLVRIAQSGPSWYLGAIEGGDSGVYNTVTVGDLRSSRPDLADLLRLPAGFMAVIGAGGIEAIFDSKNENAFKLD